MNGEAFALSTSLFFLSGLFLTVGVFIWLQDNLTFILKQMYVHERMHLVQCFFFGVCFHF